jgi:hypothetical protein
MPEEPATSPDRTRDVHRVELLSPLQRTPRWEACPSPEDAQQAFDPMDGSRRSGHSAAQFGVWEVRLVLNGRSVEERLVVRPLPRLV